MLTVLSWLWTQPGGRTKFTSEHVAIWADMVRRNLSMPHRIACVTDQRLPAGVERIDPPGEFEDIVPRWGPHRPNCFRRLSMFRRDAAKLFGERFVCMDLDVIVGGPLDPLFDRKEDLVLFNGTDASRPYNGSMMLITAGCRPQVYEDFNQAAADESGDLFFGSDQAWLCHKLGPNEATWGEADGVWFYGDHYRRQMRKADPKVLFFPGKWKPWHLSPIFPWMREHYRIVKQREAA